MLLTPVGERVLVKLGKAEEQTSSGLYIPQGSQEKTQIAQVAALGELSKLLKLKVGDKVLFDKYSGASFKDEDAEYLFLKEEDILAIVKD